MNSESTTLLKTLKLWARSGSLKFAQNSAKRNQGSSIENVEWNGHRVFYRPGTSDADILHRILLKPDPKREYHFPRDLDPRVILDIGANTGAATLLLRNYYPKAKIISFEPEPGNFEVLKLNTEHDKNIEIHCLALGNANKTAPLYIEDDAHNRGGFSLHKFGNTIASTSSIRVRHAGELMKELGINRVDLIKIDTEGAEREILDSLDNELLVNAKWICGELHGEGDFQLLEKLSHTFQIGIRKSWWSRLSHFEACHKDLKLNPF